GAHRVLPRRAAEDRLEHIEMPSGVAIARKVVAMDHRLHQRDLAMGRKNRKAAMNDRLAAKRRVLLGDAAAGAQPAPGCDDDRRHCVCHRIPAPCSLRIVALAPLTGTGKAVEMCDCARRLITISPCCNAALALALEMAKLYADAK